MQDVIRKRPGVIATRVGYTGGDVENATYRNHGSDAEQRAIAQDTDALVRRPNARCARIISVDLTADLPNDCRERVITPRRLHA